MSTIEERNPFADLNNIAQLNAIWATKTIAVMNDRNMLPELQFDLIYGFIITTNNKWELLGDDGRSLIELHYIMVTDIPIHQSSFERDAVYECIILAKGHYYNGQSYMPYALPVGRTLMTQSYQEIMHLRFNEFETRDRFMRILYIALMGDYHSDWQNI